MQQNKNMGNLENLLSNLLTPVGKAQVVLKLMGSQEVPTGAVNLIIDELEQNKDELYGWNAVASWYAAQLAEKSGQTERAIIGNYLDSRCKSPSGESGSSVAHRILRETAQIERLVDIHLANGNFRDAFALVNEFKLTSRVDDLYTLATQLTQSEKQYWRKHPTIHRSTPRMSFVEEKEPVYFTYIGAVAKAALEMGAIKRDDPRVLEGIVDFEEEGLYTYSMQLALLAGNDIRKRESFLSGLRRYKNEKDFVSALALALVGGASEEEKTNLRTSAIHQIKSDIAFVVEEPPKHKTREEQEAYDTTHTSKLEEVQHGLKWLLREDRDLGIDMYLTIVGFLDGQREHHGAATFSTFLGFDDRARESYAKHFKEKLKPTAYQAEWDSEYRDAVKKGFSDLAKEAGFSRIKYLEETGMYEEAFKTAELLGATDKIHELGRKAWKRKMDTYSPVDAVSIARRANLTEQALQSLQMLVEAEYTSKGEQGTRDAHNKLLRTMEGNGQFAFAAAYCSKFGLEQQAQVYRQVAELLKS